MSRTPSTSSVDHLDETWRSIDALCSGFTDEEWSTDTGCQGWSVQDQLSHLVDYESRAQAFARRWTCRGREPSS